MNNQAFREGVKEAFSGHNLPKPLIVPTQFPRRPHRRSLSFDSGPGGSVFIGVLPEPQSPADSIRALKKWAMELTCKKIVKQTTRKATDNDVFAGLYRAQSEYPDVYAIADDEGNSCWTLPHFVTCASSLCARPVIAKSASRMPAIFSPSRTLSSARDRFPQHRRRPTG